MILTAFRSRLREEEYAEYSLWAAEMDALARQQPGFLSAKTFAALDGERVTLVEFESLEATQAWRENVRHREAQRLGRERFYAEFQVQVCTVLRAYSFARDMASMPTRSEIP
jgi:heme-degrading monooxygenase HmoA